RERSSRSVAENRPDPSTGSARCDDAGCASFIYPSPKHRLQYGEVIGETSTAVAAGQLVHTHNLVSRRAKR
ncbi:MAG: hypothetical protein HYR63_16775, partial [Proteobacteria bacterium]|nr:hypothetical protein [Pseudomonadota bacterium]